MGNKQQLQLNNETLDSILSNVLELPAQVDPLSDTDLIPENIREGIDIWGVVGTLAEGVVGIDFGELALSSSAESVTVAHNLGATPSWVAFLPKGTITNGSSPSSLYNLNGKVDYTRKVTSSSSGKTEMQSAFADKANTLTESEITFNAYSSTAKFAAKDYYWFALA